MSTRTGGGAILSVRALTVEARDHAPVSIVQDVSFSLAEGETLGLVGESGSGKSLTVRALLRLLPEPLQVTAGEALFDGRDLLRLEGREMERLRGRQISMVFQDPLSSLNPLQTCGEQIDEALRTHGYGDGDTRRRRVTELLTAVGIPDAEHRATDYPHQFSGGMRQRVMVAIALANSPRVIVADEPTTALDVTIQAQVMNVFRELRQSQSFSMILISHDLGLIAENTEQIVVLYAGRVAETGSTREVLRTPLHPYTRALLRSLPKLDDGGGQEGYIEGRPPSPNQRPSGCPFHPRCDLRRGREKCVSEKPVSRTVGGFGERLTACHFAEELVAGPATAGALT